MKIKGPWWYYEGAEGEHYVGHINLGTVAIFTYKLRAEAFVDLLNKNPALSKIIQDLA